MKIAIIGAGIAGLTAASKLHQDHEVVVFEAAARIGGRVFTDHKFANFPVELGAEFIHGPKASSVKYFKKNHEPLITCGGFETFASLDGRKLSEVYPQNGEAIGYAMKKLPQALKLPQDMSVKAWTDKLRLPKQSRERVATMFANQYLAYPEELSIQEQAHEYGIETAGEGNFRVKNGYDRLVKILSEGLKIKLNTPVKKISWTASGVVVETSTGSWHGDKVIVTVPLSILQQGLIQFDPALPAEKLQAIESLRMGQVSKVLLKFKKPFWDTKASILLGGKHVGAWWSPGLKRPGSDPVLVGFVTRKDALLENLEQVAMSDLIEIFGTDLKKSLLKSKVMAWDQDPWIRGGYSFVPVGAFGARQTLARPLDDRVFFAGEATAYESNPATVHGALDSGLRTVREIREK